MMCWGGIKAGETRDRSQTLKATRLAFHLRKTLKLLAFFLRYLRIL